MIRGPEPTMVRVPPRIPENPMGISSREAGIFAALEIRRTAGKKRATEPMFCMKAEIRPTTVQITPRSLLSLEPARERIFRLTRFMSPVLSMPLPRIITPIMDTTALLPKPEKASLGLTRPVQARVSMTRPAITSTLKNSPTKRTIVPARTSITSRISGVRPEFMCNIIPQIFTL